MCCFSFSLYRCNHATSTPCITCSRLEFYSLVGVSSVKLQELLLQSTITLTSAMQQKHQVHHPHQLLFNARHPQGSVFVFSWLVDAHHLRPIPCRNHLQDQWQFVLCQRRTKRRRKTRTSWRACCSLLLPLPPPLPPNHRR